MEGRLYDQDLKNLIVEQNICFVSSDTHEKIVCTITALTVYPDFLAMLVGEGIDAMLPGVTHLADGVAIYESFPGYKEGVRTVGALAIRIAPYLKRFPIRNE